MHLLKSNPYKSFWPIFGWCNIVLIVMVILGFVPYSLIDEINQHEIFYYAMRIIVFWVMTNIPLAIIILLGINYINLIKKRKQLTFDCNPASSAEIKRKVIITLCALIIFEILMVMVFFYAREIDSFWRPLVETVKNPIPIFYLLYSIIALITILQLFIKFNLRYIVIFMGATALSFLFMYLREKYLIWTSAPLTSPNEVNLFNDLHGASLFFYISIFIGAVNVLFCLMLKYLIRLTHKLIDKFTKN